MGRHIGKEEDRKNLLERKRQEHYMNCLEQSQTGRRSSMMELGRQEHRKNLMGLTRVEDHIEEQEPCQLEQSMNSPELTELGLCSQQREQQESHQAS